MLKYDNTVSSTATGQPIYGAQVAVYEVDANNNNGAQAAIYADEAGTMPLSQPILTDQAGYFAFYIGDGKYNISVMTGTVEISRTNITMVDSLQLKQRALLVPVNEDSGTLPPAGARAGMLLGFDPADGSPTALAPNSFPGPTGPADNTYTSYAAMQASDPTRKSARLVGDTDVPPHPDGPYSNPTQTVGGWVPQQASGIVLTGRGAGAGSIDLERRSLATVNAVDWPGVDYTGVLDSTVGLTQAAAAAVVLGRELYMPGEYKVSRWKLPGTQPNTSNYLRISGEPTLIQGTANVPCVVIQDSPLQTSVGYIMSFVLVPHVDSDRENDANIGIDLTGFSRGKVKITLGAAPTVTAQKGRFRDLVFARSNVPFHYGCEVEVIGNNVPSPKCMYRASNGGTAASGNPNLNKVHGWVAYLTGIQAGDVMIDVGDTTQVTVSEVLFESISGATCVRAGNMCTIEHNWFEAGANSIDIKFVQTGSTTPNNCVVGRDQFSGNGHVIQIQSGLGAPPVFENCLDDVFVTYIDEGGSPAPKPASTRGYAQPAAPTFAYLAGASFTAATDVLVVRHRVDHHGRTTFFLSAAVTPAATGETVARLSLPSGFAVENVSYGMRDVTTGDGVAWGLGDNPDGQNSGGKFATTNPHRLNINVTLRAM